MLFALYRRPTFKKGCLCVQSVAWKWKMNLFLTKLMKIFAYRGRLNRHRCSNQFHDELCTLQKNICLVMVCRLSKQIPIFFFFLHLHWWHFSGVFDLSGKKNEMLAGKWDCSFEMILNAVPHGEKKMMREQEKEHSVSVFVWRNQRGFFGTKWVITHV